MTDNLKDKTICVKCANRIPDNGEQWRFDRCQCSVRSNFVLGVEDFGYCQYKNTTGDCPDYLCAVCGHDPCICGTGHMSEAEEVE